MTVTQVQRTQNNHLFSCVTFDEHLLMLQFARNGKKTPLANDLYFSLAP